MPAKPQIAARATAPSTTDAPATPMRPASPPPMAAPTMPPAPPRTSQLAVVAGEPPARSASAGRDDEEEDEGDQDPPEPAPGPPREKDDPADQERRGRHVYPPAEGPGALLTKQMAGGAEQVEVDRQPGEHPHEEEGPAPGVLGGGGEQSRQAPETAPERPENARTGLVGTCPPLFLAGSGYEGAGRSCDGLGSCRGPRGPRRRRPRALGLRGSVPGRRGLAGDDTSGHCHDRHNANTSHLR